MKRFWRAALLAAAFSTSTFAGILTFLNSPGSPVVSSVNWSLIGGDGTLFPNLQTVNGTPSNVATIGLGTSPALGGLTSVVCPAINPVNCSWGAQTSGYATGDTLIWLEGLDTNSNPVGTGPLTLTLVNSVFGEGGYIQATSSGQFSASLAVYNGVSLLGSQTYTSDSGGDPLFLGVQDSTAEINKVVVTVTQCGGFACDANDFSADTVSIYGLATATPEPVTLAPAGLLLALGFAFRKRFERGNK
jgi:hypothetical protein